MNIALDHIGIPARDNLVAAHFLSDVLGVPFDGAEGKFCPVQISESIALEFFATTRPFDPYHLAFRASEPAFDAIVQRLHERGIAYGSQPFTPDDMQTNHVFGKGLYFRDPNGHLFEVIVAAP